MTVDLLLGLQWGDEGKGKIVDVLTSKYEHASNVVCPEWIACQKRALSFAGTLRIPCAMCVLI